jgi:putative transposase
MTVSILLKNVYKNVTLIGEGLPTPPIIDRRSPLLTNPRLSTEGLLIPYHPLKKPKFKSAYIIIISLNHGLTKMERYKIQEGVGIYFVTFTVVEWLPVFINEEPCKIITESLNYCFNHKNLRVNAYVIMPNHLHAIVFDGDYDTQRLKNTLDDLRKFTGRQLADYCSKSAPQSFSEVFRKHSGEDRERRFWQPTRCPEGITTEKFWQQKVEYIHWNPVRKGLVRLPEDWRFSSAAYWVNGSPVDVQITDVMY